MLSFSNTKQLDKNHDAVVDDGPLPACSPAVVPGVGRVARRAPPPGLPAAAPMSRAPPPRAPVSLPALTIFSRNRSCVYFSVPASSTAPPGPGFRVCGPPSVPSVSARAFHVSVDRRSPWSNGIIHRPGAHKLEAIPFAATQTRVDVVWASAWGAGRRCVFPQCGVEYTWALGLVRRPVALSGLLRRSSSGA